MCGIAGIFAYKNPLGANASSLVNSMGYRLRFRGPDDDAYYQDGKKVSFAFRRLSIVDLASGNQPFISDDDQVVIMVNGEIYNHLELREKLTPDYRYRSSSDCEVVLALYQQLGMAFLDHLNGMFAIAIYDKNKQQLILARDRLGIKPLFYAITGEGHIAFASEIKAVMAHPQVNVNFNWINGITHAFARKDCQLPFNHTVFDGVEQVEPGTFLTVDSKGIVEKQWWHFPLETKLEQYSDLGEEECIALYHDLLSDSVKLRLMSDVDVGVCLSGGIDSVAIAALASQIKPLDCFTVLSNSTLLSGDAPAAYDAAKHLSLPLHPLFYPFKKNLINYSQVKRILYDVEKPFGMEEVYKYLLYDKIKRDFPTIKTVLLGQGSDEFNGGYCNVYINTILKNFPNKKHNWQHFMQAMTFHRNFSYARSVHPYINQRVDYLAGDFLNQFIDEGGLSPWAYYQKQYQRTVAVYNLWHEDRTTAANSLEARVPFLDHRLVELCLNIPKRHHKNLFWNKTILRKAIASYVTPDLAKRPKQPFFYGEGERYTHRISYELMASNNAEFWREAIIENPQVKDRLNVEKLNYQFKKVSTNPTYAGCNLLFEFASIGLLAKWCQDGMKEPIKEIDENTLNWFSIDNWESDKAQLIKKIAESPLGIEDSVCLNSGYSFVKSLDDNFDLHIVKQNRLLVKVERAQKPDFIRFLLALNPEKSIKPKSIKKLLDELKISEDKVFADIADALESGILTRHNL